VAIKEKLTDGLSFRVTPEQENKTSFKKVIFFTVLFSLSSFCYAEKVNVYISGGPTFSQLGNGTSVALNDFVTNNYITNKEAHWSPLWGIGIGHSFENIFSKPYTLSLGLTGYSINFGNVKGTEYPFANAGAFDTLNYKFKAQSNALLLESRLFYTGYSWQPFALVGIGSAWNRLSNYSEIPTDSSGSAVPLPPFSSHTENAVAYELGIGVQRQFFEDVVNKVRYAVSLDYRYLNFGKGQLGSSSVQTTGDHLHIDNLYTQGVMLSLNASL
jgi:opacity protein-like surface antigen